MPKSSMTSPRDLANSPLRVEAWQASLTAKVGFAYFQLPKLTRHVPCAHAARSGWILGSLPSQPHLRPTAWTAFWFQAITSNWVPRGSQGWQIYGKQHVSSMNILTSLCFGISVSSSRQMSMRVHSMSILSSKSSISSNLPAGTEIRQHGNSEQAFTTPAETQFERERLTKNVPQIPHGLWSLINVISSQLFTGHLWALFSDTPKQSQRRLSNRGFRALRTPQLCGSASRAFSNNSNFLGAAENLPPILGWLLLSTGPKRGHP